MMAPKLVAAKEGAMKEKRDSKLFIISNASITHGLYD